MATVHLTIDYLMTEEQLRAFAGALEHLDQMQGYLQEFMAGIPDELTGTELHLLRAHLEAMNFLLPAAQSCLWLQSSPAYLRAQQLIASSTSNQG